MAGGAIAQKPDAPGGSDPTQVAMGEEIMECVSGRVNLRAKIRQIEAELVKLKAENTKLTEKAP